MCRIGANHWRQDPIVNIKKVAKGVEDRKIVVKIEGENKKHKKSKKD